MIGENPRGESKVPNFALYGAQAQASWLDSVHFERIPERSALFDFEISPHFHDALIQVLYVTGGGGETFIDDQKWRLTPPCLIVVPARSVHGFHFQTDVDGPVITAAQRPLESLAAVAAPQLLTHLRQPAVLPVDTNSRYGEALGPLFEGVEREAGVHTQGQLGAGLPLLLALFVQIARISQSAPLGGGAWRSRKAVQVERFRGLLDQWCRQRKPVQGYAQAMGVTAGQLTRLCSEVLGMSTLDAINARALHEARRELVYSSLSIKQVAAELGFDDEAYFGRFFKKQTGQRPKEFRDTARRQLASG
ncbi:MAG: hypothetical protein RLZZ401_1120 [Pseudomonadota bacterium]|jgi:AraC family transcriptional activator of pobA